MNEPEIPNPQPAGMTNGTRIKFILALVLGPPLVNVIAVVAESADVAILTTIILLPFTSIAAGVMTSPLLAKTAGAKVLCGIFCSLGYYVVCFGLCCAGCGLFPNAFLGG